MLVAAMNGVPHCSKVASSQFIVCPNATGGFAKGGTTIGNVFITNLDLETVMTTPGLLAHEDRHATQWSQEGIAMAFNYFAEVEKSKTLYAQSPRPNCSDPEACCNSYEVGANLKDGGYLKY